MAKKKDPPAQPAKESSPGNAQPSFAGFTIRLVVYLFSISLLFSLGQLHLHLGPVQAMIASAATAGANLLGASARVSGDIIDVSTLRLEINHECTAIFILFVYAAFVLAYPAPWLERLKGIAVGAVVLTAVNVGRLVALTIIAQRKPDLFNYLHEYFFQGVFIALLALLASIWTEQVRRATLARVSA